MPTAPHDDPPGGSVVRVIGRVLSALAATIAAGGLLSVLAVPFLFLVGDTVETTRAELFDRPPLPDELPLAAEISTVHDREGTRIADLSGPVRRETVPLEEIPQVVIDAVLATEDDEFYEHPGVQHEAMVRAAARNLQAGGIAEGASTITQQYVRMALLDPEQTFDRKLHEIVWAVELEDRLDKDEILERYLNGVYLGQGVYGFGTAADHYFSRPIQELGLAEAALLAGTIRAPAVTNPVDGPEAAQQRRDVVVRQMQAQGRITEEEADEVLGTELTLDVAAPEAGEDAWVDLVKRLLYDPSVDLQPGLQEAIGDSIQERVEALFEGGLTIETTLDGELQAHARGTVADYLDDPLEQPLGSIVSVEHATGALRAVAVGPHEYGACPEDHEGPCELTQINPAVPGYGGSGRQSGSAFKPFVAAAALESELEIVPEDEIEQDDADDDADDDGDEGDENGDEEGFEDEPVEERGLVYDAPSGEPIEGCGVPGEEWEPRNYDDADQGRLGLHEAMRISSNVFFVKLARDVGIPVTVDSARAHGLVHSPNLESFSDGMCSIALGSAEVFPLELAVGYGTWANDGVRCEPYVIERVLDRNGEVLYEHEQRCERATSAEVAETMRELLREPVGSGGTAAALGQLGDDVHGKTGTTNDFVDAWFAGWAGEYSTVSWIGYEQPQPLRDVSIGNTVHDRVTGGGAPASMWGDFVAELPG
jgi:penicillin-binding protein 1A